MKPKSTVLQKFENNLTASPKLDSMTTFFKSLISLTPVGSAFSVLFSDLIPTTRTLRTEKFIKDLASDFKQFDERIDTEYIKTEEFAFLFEQCFKAANENYQQEKIEAFKAIIVNSTMYDSIHPNEKEFYLNLTKNLTVLHIHVLDFLNDTHAYIKSHHLLESQIQGRYKDFLPIIFTTVEFDTIKIIIDDLNNYGLTSLQTQSILSVTSSSGMQLLGDRHTTDYGKKYLQFIRL